MLDHLAADRARVGDLDAQILQLEGSPCALEGERAFTQERLESCCSLILDVPTEITCEIFTHFLPVYPLCPPLTGNKSPTLLTQVCRAWREIALSTPRLWRAMSLPPLAGVSTERQLQRVDLWVERSGSCPLSLEIPYTHESAVLERVLQHASRLEQLNAIIPVHSMLKAPRSLPMLRRLDLSLDDWPVPQEILLFSDAPELRTVILNHTAILGAVLPWSQLTSVTLKTVFPHECAPVLQRTLNLQFCELRLISSEQVDWPEIKLPCLVVLTLICHEESNGPITGYLDTLVVPALRTLEVLGSFLADDPIATLTSFIAKSGCELQKLRITGEITDERRYDRAAFPRIPTLSFDAPGSEWAASGSISAVDELEHF
ncbi:hypothetical protein C8R46DRAFT_1358702 [Mycena filopes]|nr:hypothetical protein C8R46DRAFT_1358702 [Mycena filopes]